MHGTHVAVVAEEERDVAAVVGRAACDAAVGAEVEFRILLCPLAVALVEGGDGVGCAVVPGAGVAEVIADRVDFETVAFPGAPDAVDADPEVVVVVGVA